MTPLEFRGAPTAVGGARENLRNPAGNGYFFQLAVGENAT